MLVTNETNEVLRVPLGKGKVLHLGPRQTGHVLRAATERPAFLRMVERKEISVRAESETPGVDTGGRGVGEEQGSQPPRLQRKGLR